MGIFLFVIFSIGLLIYICFTVSGEKRNEKLNQFKEQYKFDVVFDTNPTIGIISKTGDIYIGFDEKPSVINIKDVIKCELQFTEVNTKNRYYIEDVHLQMTLNDVNNPLLEIWGMTKEKGDELVASLNILRHNHS